MNDDNTPALSQVLFAQEFRCQHDKAQFESFDRIMAVAIDRLKNGIPLDDESVWSPLGKRREDYRVYLTSRAWYNKRQEVLARAHGRCEVCGIANVPLEVHHMVYAGHRGEEELSDLVAVCERCHAEAHRE